jgi:hypothetical protein
MRLLPMAIRLTIPIFLSALVEWGLIALAIVGLFMALPGSPHISFGLVILALPFISAFLAISLVRTGLLVLDKTSAPDVEKMIKNSILFLRNVGITLSVLFSLFLMISALLYFSDQLTREDLRLVVFNPIRALETGVAQSMVSPATTISFLLYLVMCLYIFCCNMMPLAAAAADVADPRSKVDRFWGFGVGRNMFFRYAIVILATGLPAMFILLQPVLEAFLADYKAIVATLLGDKRNTVVQETLTANLGGIIGAGVVFVLMFSVMAAVITVAFAEYRAYVDSQDKFIE